MNKIPYFSDSEISVLSDNKYTKRFMPLIMKYNTGKVTTSDIKIVRILWDFKIKAMELLDKKETGTLF